MSRREPVNKISITGLTFYITCWLILLAHILTAP